MLDEPCLLFVMMQFLPALWPEISSEIKTCSSLLQPNDEDDCDSDDEDETPVRMVIKLKSRRLNNIEEQDDQDDQHEISMSLPKSFARQQFTKQYALREYDIGPTLARTWPVSRISG
jgi:hypothetical protein